MATNVDRIQNAIDNLCQLVEAETARWLADGAKVTHSIDGESFSWNDWLKGKTEEIDALSKLKATISSPFIIRSKGRA